MDELVKPGIREGKVEIRKEKKPNLCFGLLADPHVTTPETCDLLEKSMRYLKARGVDAVMIPGDLTDWGLKSSLRYVRETWDRVFAGTGVVPLFCTGNHDYDGWRYSDMTLEMHANGYHERDRLNRGATGMAEAWEEIFGEPFAPVRSRVVKGYEFITGECCVTDELAVFMAENGGRLKGEMPFFYFQHMPIKGTTFDSFGWADSGKVGPVLEQFPNCIAFTGHTHRPFIDEKMIWQDRYTIVTAPSLSYTCMPAGYENAESAGREAGAPPVMAPLAYRRDLRGGQGYVVSVWDDRVEIERRDFEEEAVDAPNWVVPLPFGEGNRPFAPASRAAAEPAPAFPAGAKVALRTRNTWNRRGNWAIILDCRFPSATMPGGGRVYDYEIKAVPADGSAPLVRRFVVTSFGRLAKYEPPEQRFWFDARDLPQDKDYVVEVRARNSFGGASEPIASAVWHGCPGLEVADTES